jgi:glycosyltransferase involved in cell wall biosynthesis
MNQQPKISIVTVCYNAVATLENTILSVLNQTYSNVEYIVIDGGSKDGTVDIIKNYKDRLAYWISEPDKGIYDAMNKGIAVATGEWINFMNAGDILHDKDVLAQLVPQINPNTTIAYGDTLLIHKYTQEIRENLAIEEMSHQMVPGHQATFIRTAFHKAHPFDTSFKSSADYNFFYNAYFNWKAIFQYIPVLIVDYEAEMGFSRKNLRVARYEDAKIQGVKIDAIWELKLTASLSFMQFKDTIKRFIPENILKNIALIKQKKVSD